MTLNPKHNKHARRQCPLYPVLKPGEVGKRGFDGALVIRISGGNNHSKYLPK